ncbi:imelysin family protein [Methyloceanibacter sp.]|uniref:imelysin family protein n=1 Tax=Methyloceanibacter sp. TaxID=1965321 RepID=UPI003D6D4CD4
MSADTPVQAEADHAVIAKASLEQYIRPGYAHLADSTEALNQSVAALCRTPSASALRDTQNAFAATVEAWSLVEPIRFGPVAEQHRYERIFYWPDPKGLGTRQMREALGRQDQSVTEAASLSGKSVALQGLPALEYLLYGDDAGTLAKGGGAATFRCRFAEIIAGNVAGMAKDIAAGWQDGAAYTKAYLDPGPANSAYHTQKEVTLELFKTFATGIELVRDQKMAKALGPKPEQARPQLAPFWRSGLSFANMADNLLSVRELFAKGGFAQVVHDDTAGVEDSIVFDLNHAIEVLRGLDKPITQAVHDEDIRAKLEALRVSLKAAATTAGDMISRGAGLTFGFNAMDGD